jgi:hypothetical protein
MTEAKPEPFDVRWLGELQALKLKPGEKFVLQFQTILNPEQRERVLEQWNRFMPGVELLVVEGGARLSAAQVPEQQKE